MITIRVNDTIRELRKGFEFLSKQQLARATSQAINQTLLLGRSEARRAVKRVYNIPQKNLNGINIRKANINFLQGSIYASSKPIPMDAFSPKFEFIPSHGMSSMLTVSRRGVLKAKTITRAKGMGGVSIEVKRGERVTVPYAFLIPGAKPRVFARGVYKGGAGSYGFIQRHTREPNASGNDSVKPLISVTIFGAVVNPVVKKQIARKVQHGFPDNMIKALKRQANIL
jgi:hypothetical protein